MIIIKKVYYEEEEWLFLLCIISQPFRISKYLRKARKYFIECLKEEIYNFFKSSLLSRFQTLNSPCSVCYSSPRSCGSWRLASTPALLWSPYPAWSYPLSCRPSERPACGKHVPHAAHQTPSLAPCSRCGLSDRWPGRSRTRLLPGERKGLMIRIRDLREGEWLCGVHGGVEFIVTDIHKIIKIK